MKLADYFLLSLKPREMIVNENNEMPYMKSLTTCLNRIVADGYKEDFKITEKGLYWIERNKEYTPDQVHIVNFFRFEGNSDPDDNAILYVIETDDGVRGTLVDGYGIYGDPQVGKFIKKVEDISKKVVKE